MFPATADWCEYEGTVTNSERRVQRVRKAIDPPGLARDTHAICALATKLGHDWGEPTAEEVWDELRSVSLNWHAGMSYERLDELGGIQWPCPSLDHPGTPLMHARLWAEPAERDAGAVHRGRARGARRRPRRRVPDPPDHRPAARRLQLRRADRRLRLPLRRRESLRIDAEDAARLGIENGEPVRVVSRRGAVEAPIGIDPSLRPGLASFTPHFSEEVDVNVLTNDAWDPKSGTSEFKATAVRVEKIGAMTAAHTARLPAAGS